MEGIYCAEQIKIPPGYPEILKQYVKAAIRTQPYDLLQWTCAYFSALANGEIPPVKPRLEYPPFEHPTKITPGLLKALLGRHGHVEKLALRELLEDWQGMALDQKVLYQIFYIGEFLGEEECAFYEFLAIACGFIGRNLRQTMIYICELLTDEPEGGSAMIPVRVFLNLYILLAKLDGSGPTKFGSAAGEGEGLVRPCGRTSGSDVVCSEFGAEMNGSERPASQEESCSCLKEDASSAGIPDIESTRLLSESSEIPPPCKDDDLTPDVMDELLAMEPSGGEIKSKSESSLSDQYQPIEKNEIDVVMGPSISVTRDEYDNQVDQEQQDQAECKPELLDEDFDAKLSDDIFSLDFLGATGSGEEAEMLEEFEEYYEPIGLENILQGICECLEPVREDEEERFSTPPLLDPFEVFLEKMQEEVQQGSLQTSLELPGIGPPVSEERITLVGLWLGECALRQADQVGPRNLRHALCPDLEDVKHEEEKYTLD